MNLLLLILFETAIAAPLEDTRSLMVAGQLAVTAEPFEDGGTTVSLNIAPLIVEWAATERLGLRANSVLNLQFSGPDTGLSHRGGGLSIPVYLSGRQELTPYQCLYVAPHISVTSNPLVDGWDLTTAGEVGVRFRLGEHGVLNLAGQLGASRLDRPGGDRWVNHFGLYPSVGVWVW